METYLNDKKLVARWMRRMYKKGLTTSMGGNISIRIGEDRILISSSGTDKGRIKSEEIALVKLDGTIIDSHLKVSIETGLHLAIYSKRPDVNAIIHAHPVMSGLFASVNKQVNTTLLAEAYVQLGSVVKVDYSPPGSDQLAKNVSKASADTDVIIMKNHGVLALGSSLLQAFDKIEVLDNAAKMTVLTSLLGNKSELSLSQLEDLDRLFG